MPAGRRCVERAEVERFGKLDCRHRSHEPTAGRADIDAQRFDAVGRCEVEDERFDAVAVVVEYGVRQRKRLGHVMSGPCESRRIGVFEKLFQQVVGAVYDERVVLNDVVVHRYLKQKRSFVGIVDYDRNLTPLAALTPVICLLNCAGMSVSAKTPSKLKSSVFSMSSDLK